MSKRKIPFFGQESRELNAFANRLRDCLGLAPLYHDDRSAKEPDEIARFYVDTAPATQIFDKLMGKNK